MRYLMSIITAGLFLITANSVLAEESSGSSDSEPLFIEFTPLSVSVIQRTRVAGFLSVAFNLVVENEEAAAHVERLRPRLRDAIVRILSRVANSRLDINRPVDVDLIRAYVQMAVDGVLGAEKARVLMETVSLQPA
ncbi:MAG: hypothetical protein IID51_06235 [Proteobacteria bacterium]|nr:hypothetical protein [Pseudomonadota bacterium]